jgi:hypothetical protein
MLTYYPLEPYRQCWPKWCIPEQTAYMTPITELASYRQIAANRQWSTIGSFIYIYKLSKANKTLSCTSVNSRWRLRKCYRCCILTVTLGPGSHQQNVSCLRGTQRGRYICKESGLYLYSMKLPSLPYIFYLILSNPKPIYLQFVP